ncbi:MAG: ribosome modulation factor [Haliea sp.]|nr:ribosome modulation factor [Haliea sp.]
MKRQKRDMSSRAYDRGYQAGVTGRSIDFCPHANEEPRQQWVSGVHKLRMS